MTKHTLELSSGQRVALFDEARRLSPVLGQMFQNPMMINARMITEEMDALDDIAKESARKNRAYKESLRNMLVALGQGKEKL